MKVIITKFYKDSNKKIEKFVILEKSHKRHNGTKVTYYEGGGKVYQHTFCDDCKKKLAFHTNVPATEIFGEYLEYETSPEKVNESLEVIHWGN
jgi:hypothetical protein